MFKTKLKDLLKKFPKENSFSLANYWNINGQIFWEEVSPDTLDNLEILKNSKKLISDSLSWTSSKFHFQNLKQKN